MRKVNAHWIGAIAGLILVLALGLFLHRFNIGQGLTRFSFDLLLVLRGEVSAPEAVLVYLDEKSFQELDQPQNIPLDRSLHARLVDRLTAAGARAVVFDIVFSDPSVHGPASDAAFAQAMQSNGRVILAADKVSTGFARWEITPPIDLLLDAAAAMGTAELEADPDVAVRRHTPVDPSYVPTLSWAAASFVEAPITLQTNAAPNERWMNYYGPANFLDGVRFSEAITAGLVPDAFFRDKVVFVGARSFTKSAAARKDEYANPYTFWSAGQITREQGSLFMPGVEIQATAFLNLFRGDWLIRTPRTGETAVVILVAILLGAGLALLRPVLAAPAGLLAMVGILAGSYLLFRAQLVWGPWLILELQVALALAWSILFNSVQLYVQKRLAEQSLALYLSPKLVKKFSKNPKLLQPGAEKQVVTVMFSDIANFTSISEGMDSDELARLMNNYFHKAVSQCIHRTDGTVVKYIGDAIFAFWNAPEEQHDHQARACEAALLFRDTGVEVVKGVPLYTRIGLHTGVANVGNFGSTQRVDYTALGESINLAARMEGLNKYLGTALLITGETKAGLEDRFVLRALGRFRLKGFERLVDVYELLSHSHEDADSRCWRDAFAHALSLFQKKEFAAAATAFAAVLRLRSEDGPSVFYLARIEELRDQPLPDHWQGEIELKEK